jgi:benzoate membrane transport protein
MFSHLERPQLARPGWTQLRADFAPTYAANAFVAWIFTVTAPLAIILAVGTRGGLSEAELASWVFGVFCINGVITMLLSWLYRQPLAIAWTIPGTVLVGPALGHLTFPEVVGAFLATGVLILLLGATGWVRRAMQAVPMPIVIGMVAGVFLRFGLDLVRALHEDFVIAGPMVVTFLLLAAVPALAKRVPPMIGTLLVGALFAAALGRVDTAAIGAIELARPVLQTPVWSLPAMLELVLPLAITVLVVQNGQGFAVLKAAGHEPPVDSITVACGVGSILCALVGSVSTCLTGPSNAILVASGERSRHYVAGIVYGALIIAFGLLSPAFTRLFLNAPKAFIAVLAGLALLRVLQAAFNTSFRDRFSFGALVSFLVTVADLPLFNIGAAFWGLVAGIAVAWLLERRDFAAVAAG